MNRGIFNKTRLLSAPSNLTVDTSRDEAPTTSQGILVQFHHSHQNFFFHIPSLNWHPFSLKTVALVLSPSPWSRARQLQFQEDKCLRNVICLVNIWGKNKWNVSSDERTNRVLGSGQCWTNCAGRFTSMQICKDYFCGGDPHRQLLMVSVSKCQLILLVALLC